MSFDLYYLDISPPCRATLAVAQCLGLKPNIKPVNLLKGEHKTAEYLKINPTHTVPTMVDNGFVLFESRAIMKYLIAKYKPDCHLYPKDLKQRALIDQFLFFDCGSVFTAIRNVLYPKLFSKQEPPQEALDNFAEKLAMLETMIGNKKFLIGDNVTLADISLASEFPNLRLVREGLITPKILEYQRRVEAACPHLQKLNQVIDKALQSA